MGDIEHENVNYDSQVVVLIAHAVDQTSHSSLRLLLCVQRVVFLALVDQLVEHRWVGRRLNKSEEFVPRAELDERSFRLLRRLDVNLLLADSCAHEGVAVHLGLTWKVHFPRG